MSTAINDLVFTEALRALLNLKPDADLGFVSDPDEREDLDGCAPGWLYRALPPCEKRHIVLDYCAGDSARNIAKRFKRGRGTVVDLLKGVGVYLSPPERDPKKIEIWRSRVSEFLAKEEIKDWHAQWKLAWGRRKWCAAIVKEEEAQL
jgi:hypothetical protein